jgi:hypothetical protein
MPLISQSPHVVIPAQEANKWRISQFSFRTPEAGLPELTVWIVAEFDHGGGSVEFVSMHEYQAEGLAVAAAMMAPTTGAPIYFDVRDALYTFAQDQGWIPAEAEYVEAPSTPPSQANTAA